MVGKGQERVLRTQVRIGDASEDSKGQRDDPDKGQHVKVKARPEFELDVTTCRMTVPHMRAARRMADA
jgi:hypothetical protein